MALTAIGNPNSMSNASPPLNSTYQHQIKLNLKPKRRGETQKLNSKSLKSPNHQSKKIASLY
uniref:Uncharacterized protein n=1 Tax=Rhizophora mucronata TaxID=61149 RepID=A0A2P2PEC5_RHIMU